MPMDFLWKCLAIARRIKSFRSASSMRFESDALISRRRLWKITLPSPNSRNAPSRVA